MKDILITNNTNIKFLTKIKESLRNCLNCYFSVSFIKKAGLVLFEKELEDVDLSKFFGHFFIESHS